MMRVTRWTILMAMLLLSSPVYADCEDYWDWVAKSCRRLVDTYQNGYTEVLVSGYAWHIPATWTPEKRAELNANQWGGGLAKTTEDDDGNNHTVFFLAFEDSHKHVESQIGYGYTKFFGAREGVQVGLGYTVMLVQRVDIANGVPFPALLPLLEFRYSKATLMTTYIPRLGGGINHGDTLYIFGRYALN